MDQLVENNPDDVAVRDGRYTRHDERRRQLLDEAIAYLFREGLAGLSIRPMAEALGISHRTLLHHFGSKEEMVARVLSEVRRRQLEELRQRIGSGGGDLVAMLDAFWTQLSAPERFPFWRAFFEIYGIAAKNPGQYGEFLDGVQAWLPALTRAAIAAGMSPGRAETLATLIQASSRGLIIDLLTTGDHARVAQAYAMVRLGVQMELDAARKKPKAAKR